MPSSGPRSCGTSTVSTRTWNSQISAACRAGSAATVPSPANSSQRSGRRSGQNRLITSRMGTAGAAVTTAEPSPAGARAWRRAFSGRTAKGPCGVWRPVGLEARSRRGPFALLTGGGQSRVGRVRRRRRVRVVRRPSPRLAGVTAAKIPERAELEIADRADPSCCHQGVLLGALIRLGRTAHAHDGEHAAQLGDDLPHRRTPIRA